MERDEEERHESQDQFFPGLNDSGNWARTGNQVPPPKTDEHHKPNTESFDRPSSAYLSPSNLSHAIQIVSFQAPQLATVTNSHLVPSAPTSDPDATLGFFSPGSAEVEWYIFCSHGDEL